MRLFEWIFVLVTIVAALGLPFYPKRKKLATGMLSALIIAFLLHAVIDSLRVMLLPSYIVAVILFILFIFRLMRSSRRGAGLTSTPYKKRSRVQTWLRGLLIFILAAFSGVGSGLLTRYFPAFTMPEPTGQFAMGTFSQRLVDESREETLSPEIGDKRELMINVWYPVDPQAAKGIKPESYPAELGEAISLVFGIPPKVFSYLNTIPTHVVKGAAMSKANSTYPVVLFSPGVRSARFQSMTAVEELVSHGYIVVGMDHPYTSAQVTFPDGHAVSYEAGPKFATSQELYQYNVEGVGIRAADARFVLDTLEQWNVNDPNHVLEGKLDLNHTGIMGHSYGGATAAEALAQDERLHAGLSLEGGFWGTVSKTALKQPFMYIMSGETAKSFDPKASAKDKVFYPEFEPDLKHVMTSSLNDTYFLTVDGFFHQSFTDIALISPRLFAKHMPAEHNIDITRSYALAFFDRYLKGEAQPLLQGSSAKFPEASYDQEYTKIRNK
ncbi:lipase [Paenibacillus barcinonensis]|uniref:Lipase n=1 Tax=Paenibacillus barcinonensis TaxID=198119 RepID=A0A2V4W562_PAEBA|nr:lipase [Paenibacillus barcinonensis]PYE42784.1 platelet-activating factor acetylhydrolase isoform II [Paenibacillus barcinonensis]QKS57154.1 lipase [Paenibacillus barcinonensis]